MPETEKKSGFKKRAHRPWETDLLEETIQEASIDLVDDSAFEINFELEDELNIEPLPEFSFVVAEPASTAIADSKFNQIEAISVAEQFAYNNSNQELKNSIQQTRTQQESLLQQINTKNNSSILLGGFFQPKQLKNVETNNGRKLQALLNDLSKREQELNSLTSNLKLSEAVERAKQSELTRKTEAHNRQNAEQRMREAIEQAQIASEQFRTAMEQANQAVEAQQEEEKLRLTAEAQAKEAKFRANQAEISMQNERLARMAADDKAEQAMIKAEHAVLVQRQLQETLEQVTKLELAKKTEENRRIDLQQKYDDLQAQIVKLDSDHFPCASSIRNLENSNRDLASANSILEHKLNHLKAMLEQKASEAEDQLAHKMTEAEAKLAQKVHEFEQKIAELTSLLEQKKLETHMQADKLKTIITTEQELRKLSERKMLEAQHKLEKTEKARAALQQEVVVIEERAKRVVEHASRTVMHMLNAPPQAKDYGLQNLELDKPLEKMKIKVPAETNEVKEYELTEEDFKF